MIERTIANDYSPKERMPADGAIFDDAYSASGARNGNSAPYKAQSNIMAQAAERELVAKGCIPGIEWEDEANQFIKETLTPIMAPESEEAKQWLHEIDGLDDPGTLWNGHDGNITQKGVEQFIREANQDKDASPEKKEYVEKLEKLLDNWNAEWSIYLQSDGPAYQAYDRETMEKAAALTTVNAAMNTCD